MISRSHSVRGSDGRSCSFNMTPLIDVVFLLIIFFLVVCQFVEAENYPVDIPDGCEFALAESESAGRSTTLTLRRGSAGESLFAVGSEAVSGSARGEELVSRLAGLIDEGLVESDGRGVVVLRIDEDIDFADAQRALEAVGRSSAARVQMAVLRERSVRASGDEGGVEN